jgi:hypothetical protein
MNTASRISGRTANSALALFTMTLRKQTPRHRLIFAFPVNRSPDCRFLHESAPVFLAYRFPVLEHDDILGSDLDTQLPKTSLRSVKSIVSLLNRNWPGTSLILEVFQKLPLLENSYRPIPNKVL